MTDPLDRIIDEHAVSAEARDRWPNGTYDGRPCTCKASCDFPCKGTDCGCEACWAAWNDYLSMPDT